MYSVLLFPQTLQSIRQYNIIPKMKYSNMYSVLLFPQTLQSVNQYNIITIDDVQQHKQRAVVPSEFTVRPSV
jgi:hypothetical protein